LTQFHELSDNLHVLFFLDGEARCSFRREDCGPRREEPLPYYRSGRVRRLRRSL